MWFRKKQKTAFEPMEFGDYLFKEASKEDWQAFRAFYLRALKERPTCSWESYEEAKQIPPEQWVSRIAYSASSVYSLTCLMIHKSSREIVGVAIIESNSDANISHQAWVKAYFVVEQHRDPKITAAFLRAMFKYFQQFTNVRKIKAPVVADDRTQILALNELGFTRYGYDDGYYRIGNKYKDAVLMLKRL